MMLTLWERSGGGDPRSGCGAGHETLRQQGNPYSGATITMAYNDNTIPFTTTITAYVDASTTYSILRKYDGMGRQFQINSGGVITDTFYSVDSAAHTTTTQQSVPYQGSSPNLFTTTVVNAATRTTTVTAPDQTSTSTHTDGLSTTVIDANGNSTMTTKDVWGRVMTVTPPTGPRVGYVYNSLDEMTKAIRGTSTDVSNCLSNPTSANCPSNETMSLTYDSAGRKTSMSDPDMGNWIYAYDAMGNLTSQNDARTCVTTLGYDALNRLTDKTYSNCVSAALTPAVHNHYDVGDNGVGRRTSVNTGEDSSPTVSTSWTYDARGSVTSETTQGYTTHWTYNNADQPLTMTYPDNEVVTNHYNPLMQLDSLIGTNTYVQSVGYDSAGRLTQQLLGDGLTQQFNYYAWDDKITVNGQPIGQGGRLENITTGTLQNLNYQYDKAGNIAQTVDTVNSETSTYGYDALNRLTNWTLNGTQETYAYDPNTGNLSSKAGTNYTAYDPNHAHAVASLSNGNSYLYDNDGNMITRVIGSDTFSLKYDAENRLVEVDKNGPAIANFVYDGDGNRVQSTIGGTTTTFVSNYYENTSGAVTKYYYAGASRIAMRKYTIPQPMTVEYFLGDQLGSTSLTTDNTGVKVSEIKYKPWGEVRSAWYNPDLNDPQKPDKKTSPTYALTSYTFTGQYSDSYINLLWYGSREYDPVIGRFISPDTIVPTSTQGVQAWDRYAYANNNPVRYTDPSGHCITDPFSATLCAAIAYVSAAMYVSARTLTAQPVGDNASNIWELVKLGVEQADHAYITGDGLKNLEDDPSVQAKENKIADDITGDPRYGKQAFSIQGDYTDPKEPSFTADGPSRNFAIGFLTGNQGFLMVHSATLYATDTQVSENGTISTTWKVEDQFDYLPDWQNHARPHYWEYNLTAQFVVAPIYYGWLNAKAQVPDTAEWHQTIPSHDWWDDSCSRCE